LLRWCDTCSEWLHCCDSCVAVLQKCGGGVGKLQNCKIWNPLGGICYCVSLRGLIMRGRFSVAFMPSRCAVAWVLGALRDDAGLCWGIAVLRLEGVFPVTVGVCPVGMGICGRFSVDSVSVDCLRCWFDTVVLATVGICSSVHLFTSGHGMSMAALPKCTGKRHCMWVSVQICTLPHIKNRAGRTIPGLRGAVADRACCLSHAWWVG
jgi:hypothetical protein